jgi:hypothetical protein
MILVLFITLLKILISDVSDTIIFTTSSLQIEVIIYYDEIVNN